MGDQQHALVGPPIFLGPHDRVDARADDPQRVDIEARVRLVEHREGGIEDAHLHHLGALLLAAGEADIHLPLEHFHVHFQEPRLFLGELEELAAGERLLAAALALRIERLAQELDVGDAGDLDRILKAEEQASGGTFVRVERQQILSAKLYAAAGHFVARLAAEHIRQRRFARAVRAHDRMYLARRHVQAQTLEDRLIAYLRVKIGDGEHY